MRVLPRAKHSVYIADWYFSPGLYLVRGRQLDKKYCLDNFLKRLQTLTHHVVVSLSKHPFPNTHTHSIADQGVQIYIIVWNAPSVGFSLESKYVVDRMNSMHSNITAIRHPTFTPITWSHHQKFGTKFVTIHACGRVRCEVCEIMSCAALSSIVSAITIVVVVTCMPINIHF